MGHGRDVTNYLSQMGTGLIRIELDERRIHAI